MTIGLVELPVRFRMSVLEVLQSQTPFTSFMTLLLMTKVLTMTNVGDLFSR